MNLIKTPLLFGNKLIVFLIQEISEMLGGKISNQDEDEVEEELEALQAELTGVLPEVPSTELPPKVRAEAREKWKEKARQAMLAS
jgi:charged multivesicular body protein 6